MGKGFYSKYYFSAVNKENLFVCTLADIQCKVSSALPIGIQKKVHIKGLTREKEAGPETNKID